MVWSDRGSNWRSTTLEVSTLTITPQMRYPGPHHHLIENYIVLAMIYLKNCWVGVKQQSLTVNEYFTGQNHFLVTIYHTRGEHANHYTTDAVSRYDDHTTELYNIGLGLLCLTPLSKIFQLFVMVSFIAGGNRSIQRKPPTYRKSLTNFIT
jgi:hypothetical protein